MIEDIIFHIGLLKPSSMIQDLVRLRIQSVYTFFFKVNINFSLILDRITSFS